MNKQSKLYALFKGLIFFCLFFADLAVCLQPRTETFLSFSFLLSSVVACTMFWKGAELGGCWWSQRAGHIPCDRDIVRNQW